MSEKINNKDRDVILKLVTVSVCVLELFITIFTLIYQQDVIKHIETPITEEMAKVYIDHPEKLKPNERLALNTYGNERNQQTYLLVQDEEQVIPFPWKAWILTSVGVPIGLGFLVLLLTKAYFQVIEPNESETAESSSKFASALNQLGQINIIWFMLISIVVIFLFWYIPEIIKYMGSVAITWLTKYWWVPTTVFLVVVLLISFGIYLQYKLKLKAMHLEMEMAKFKFLQLEGKSHILIDNKTSQPIHLLEGNSQKEGLPENQNEALSA